MLCSQPVSVGRIREVPGEDSDDVSQIGSCRIDQVAVGLDLLIAVSFEVGAHAVGEDSRFHVQCSGSGIILVEKAAIKSICRTNSRSCAARASSTRIESRLRHRPPETRGHSVGRQLADCQGTQSCFAAHNCAALSYLYVKVTTALGIIVPGLGLLEFGLRRLFADSKGRPVELRGAE
eukprot:IDg5397t1